MRETASPIAEPRRHQARRTGLRHLAASLVACLGLVCAAPVEAGFAEGYAAYHNGDYETAFEEFLPLAQAGDEVAQFNLGFMYDFGEGIPENDAEAVRWYRRAAEQGHAPAQFGLGVMYDIGEGVPENNADAVRWYRRAAEQGHAWAQSILGGMYEHGEGVSVDWIEAQFWFNLAAASFPSGADRDQAARDRDRVQAWLSREQIAQAQARAKHWRPKVEDATSDAAELAGPLTSSADIQVREVQSLLGSLGYDPGPIDGIMGQKTRAAISGFQRLAGLSVDGEVTELLVAALRFAVAIQSEPAAIAPERTLAATGSGFAVTLDGLVLTSEHVVGGCGELRVRPPEGGLTVTASLLALDATNDLALLETPFRFAASAVFRDGRGIRAGDGVVVVGHPLRGLLADEASVTTGAVSALAGLGNDARYLQLTAPVQPGNSGGPLVDMSGRVVGVVVAKLDALRIADATGDIPQNVNFALKSAIVRSFLHANDVAYASAPPAAAMTAADVGAGTKAVTVPVECWR